ncbi:MAG: prolyl-tRNA synthetase associated domain-containing protein [Arenicellales bacterium]|nr:prolyl-tRNA synthetase associated domain-containing protein [Arenicellales bacterium]MDP6949025.1 prolyl-tRNA synthetase associated domain-containing protein [Arenicellales bacterium]
MDQTHIAQQLLDGSPPATAETLLDTLQTLGIDAVTVSHPPMFTVADSKRLRATPVEGGYTKNLFVRNKKGRMWLFTCQEDRTVDLGALAAAVNGGRFSFASRQRLMHYLGVTAGAVTPLALVNDTLCAVQFAIDSVLLTHETIHLHPLDNRQTTTMATTDLLQFAAHSGHCPLRIDFAPDGSAHCPGEATLASPTATRS